jgi:hypothetical protein
MSSIAAAQSTAYLSDRRSINPGRRIEFLVGTRRHSPRLSRTERAGGDRDNYPFATSPNRDRAAAFSLRLSSRLGRPLIIIPAVPMEFSAGTGERICQRGA